jgi:hypothetical protein
MNQSIGDIILEGSRARLEPAGPEYLEGLYHRKLEIGDDERPEVRAKRPGHLAEM